jgi:hypothetical protein
MYNLFIHWSVDGPDCSQFLTFTNQASVNIQAQVFLQAHILFRLHKFLGLEYMDQVLDVCLT